MIGIDYDLFWTLNPMSLKPFIKAFSLKREYEDVKAWQQGVYFQEAIASSLSKSYKYPTKPLFSGNNVVKEVTQSADDIKEKFLQQMALLNSRFEKE